MKEFLNSPNEPQRTGSLLNQKKNGDLAWVPNANQHDS
jgi:hypothetical protein